ncbi:hypothetical protein MKW92_000481, partial [Papaver armeniacum]
MATSSGNKVTVAAARHLIDSDKIFHGIDHDKITEMANERLFGCARKTHGSESCAEGCQFVIHEKLR